VTPFALSVLKYSLLSLLYLFIYRAIRSMVADVRGPKTARRQSPAPPQRASSRRRAAPATVAVRSVDGKRLGTHRLSAPVQIGRSESCGIRLEDGYVSQVHAKLYGVNGAWYVEDLGSTNGTYVNDSRIATPIEVHSGDRIRVGRTTLELKR